MNIYCYFDGSCSINPGGVIGIGYTIDNNRYSDKIGKQPSNSNNIAEYKALYFLLEKLIENNLQDENIIVRGDSLLIINQINDKWKAKKPHLQSLYNQCKDLLV